MRSLKGSYTVEAAMVFSICFFLLGSAILLGFDVYHEVYSQVSQEQKSPDVLRIFRISELGEEIWK